MERRWHVTSASPPASVPYDISLLYEVIFTLKTSAHSNPAIVTISTTFKLSGLTTGSWPVSISAWWIAETNAHYDHVFQYFTVCLLTAVTPIFCWDVMCSLWLVFLEARILSLITLPVVDGFVQCFQTLCFWHFWVMWTVRFSGHLACELQRYFYKCLIHISWKHAGYDFITMLLACLEACSNISFRLTLSVFLGRAQCFQTVFLVLLRNMNTRLPVTWQTWNASLCHFIMLGSHGFGNNIVVVTAQLKNVRTSVPLYFTQFWRACKKL